MSCLIEGLGTVTNLECKAIPNGYGVSFVTGQPVAAAAVITLPNGLRISLAKLACAVFRNGQVVEISVEGKL